MQTKSTSKPFFMRLLKKFSAVLGALFISGSKKKFKRLKDFIAS
jgi:hypothetical protein